MSSLSVLRRPEDAKAMPKLFDNKVLESCFMAKAVFSHSNFASCFHAQNPFVRLRSGAGLGRWLHVCGYELFRRSSIDTVSVGAQLSHSAGMRINQRACSGFNWPFPSIETLDKVNRACIAREI